MSTFSLELTIGRSCCRQVSMILVEGEWRDFDQADIVKGMISK